MIGRSAWTATSSSIRFSFIHAFDWFGYRPDGPTTPLGLPRDCRMSAWRYRLAPSSSALVQRAAVPKDLFPSRRDHLLQARVANAKRTIFPDVRLKILAHLKGLSASLATPLKTFRPIGLHEWIVRSVVKAIGNAQIPLFVSHVRLSFLPGDLKALCQSSSILSGGSKHTDCTKCKNSAPALRRGCRFRIS